MGLPQQIWKRILNLNLIKNVFKRMIWNITNTSVIYSGPSGFSSVRSASNKYLGTQSRLILNTVSSVITIADLTDLTAPTTFTIAGITCRGDQHVIYNILFCIYFTPKTFSSYLLSTSDGSVFSSSPLWYFKYYCFD